MKYIFILTTRHFEDVEIRVAPEPFHPFKFKLLFELLLLIIFFFTSQSSLAQVKVWGDYIRVKLRATLPCVGRVDDDKRL